MMTPESALARARILDPSCELFVVRVYAGFEGTWTDVAGPFGAAEAMADWFVRTRGGTQATGIGNVDYYVISPAAVAVGATWEGRR